MRRGAWALLLIAAACGGRTSLPVDERLATASGGLGSGSGDGDGDDDSDGDGGASLVGGSYGTGGASVGAGGGGVGGDIRTGGSPSVGGNGAHQEPTQYCSLQAHLLAPPVSLFADDRGLFALEVGTQSVIQRRTLTEWKSFWSITGGLPSARLTGDHEGTLFAYGLLQCSIVAINSNGVDSCSGVPAYVSGLHLSNFERGFAVGGTSIYSFNGDQWERFGSDLPAVATGSIWSEGGFYWIPTPEGLFVHTPPESPSMEVVIGPEAMSVVAGEPGVRWAVQDDATVWADTGGGWTVLGEPDALCAAPKHAWSSGGVLYISDGKSLVTFNGAGETTVVETFGCDSSSDITSIIGDQDGIVYYSVVDDSRLSDACEGVSLWAHAPGQDPWRV